MTTLRFDKPRAARRRTPQAPHRGEERSDESIPTSALAKGLEPGRRGLFLCGGDGGFDENRSFGYILRTEI
jgi:hypothetical protein